jgi:3'-phosphoadenosine 5'-phosphosulfate (PAPS) 3'-phosphatase
LSFWGLGVAVAVGVGGAVVGVALGDSLTLGATLGSAEVGTLGACAPVWEDLSESPELQPVASVRVAATAAASVRAFRTMRSSRPTRRSLPKTSHNAHQSGNEIVSQPHRDRRGQTVSDEIERAADAVVKKSQVQFGYVMDGQRPARRA